MKDYALITLLRGHCSSMGLPEVTFHYPLLDDRENQLSVKALNVMNTYPFLKNYYWALVDEKDYETFLHKINEISQEKSNTIIIPKDILHGEISFDVKFRFDNYTQSDKDKLVKKIVETGIVPSRNALDLSYSIREREMKVFGISPDDKELQNEQRATFARNLTFYKE